jgi:hypothetical protein
MPDSATLEHTCDRCRVTVSWMAGHERPKLPESWSEKNGVMHCLGCQRELAGEAGLASLPEDAPAADRQRTSAHARLDFEVKRDPDRPDNRIAKSCHTSIIAVRKARERLGLPPGP